LDITLSTEQEALFEMMERTDQHLFITGRAGTGKSVLLRHFRENTKKKAVVAAPTGIAALNVRGQTIHSLFRLPPQFQEKGELEPNERACRLLKRIKTLIIDEISMVRADLLDAIDERLREAFDTSTPFGGIQLVMFGDVYQLPPVVDDGLAKYFEDNHKGYFFFNASVWERAEFKIYELSQVFRQKDPVFKSVLNAVRDGTVTDEQLKLLNARYSIPIPDEGVVTLATTNALVTGINQRKLDQLPEKLHEYKANITGQMKKPVFPTEEKLQLKVGAQVVLLRNDKDGRWVNGTVGKIDSLKDDEINVRIAGIVYPIGRETWEEIVYEYDRESQKVTSKATSSFTQYPVRLAWALTIHKSQGQTYESVALDLTTATFASGQLYVALSRCTSLEGLYLKMPVRRSHIIVEPRVIDFMLRQEAIIVEASEVVVEAKQEPQIEAAMPVILAAAAPLMSASSNGQEQQLSQQEETVAPKKRGRPRTGRTKANVTFSLNNSVIEYLNSLANQSETVNDLIMESEAYQRWAEIHVGTPHFS
jgi:ATP-dependent DNA helicase PIF1